MVRTSCEHLYFSDWISILLSIGSHGSSAILRRKTRESGMSERGFTLSRRARAISCRMTKGHRNGATSDSKQAGGGGCQRHAPSPELGELALVVEGAQGIQLLQRTNERFRGRGVHEVKVDQVVDAQRLQAQRACVSQ